ncbi:unnamed protein product [Penicillium salamii]|uniref:P-type ATPase N-terminal domain-containing protein n=1 Tax=Penicillium salamii TaxID=1612424 RepID=A0A9W4J2W5_9EURO|nr:unnamed protein product [Penicillium salamii]CAG7993387.1 unnamed protein product [Penicillium salamii]CAG8293253.1 unnamed protein product [Penicillium salamii]CAG8366319.1 unnamed protein product [Penicillium salamii]CAG8602520.1 unnamed protein product [Penicillium salamii]
MPSSPDYQHPLDHPDAPDDFSDSDDDLDLEELDPSTASPQQSRESRDYTGRKRSFGPGIALRNLRVGAGSRWRRSASGRGEFDDDTDALLENREEQGVRDSHASSRNLEEDGLPLLDRRASTRDFGNDPPKKARFLRFPFKTPAFLQGRSVQLVGDDNETVDQPPRQVLVGQHQAAKYPANVVSNAKYTPWSFLPRTLYNEFSFFFNIYFLLVAMSQIIPVLRIGYMSSYIAPLAFVVSISLGKEALDDIGRRRRDAEANSEEYCTLTVGRNNTMEVIKKSRDLKVGDILKVRKNQRLPADVVILKSISNDSGSPRPSIAPEETSPQPTDLLESGQGSSEPQVQITSTPDEDSSDSAGDTFIRTDQLDGETDWKLRLPSVLSQSVPLADLSRLHITASAPDKRVNEFQKLQQISLLRRRL